MATDFSNISDEELKAELARRQKMDKNETTVEDEYFKYLKTPEGKAEFAAQNSPNTDSSPVADNPTGISNPADFIGKISSKWDERKSYKHGKKFSDNMQVAKEAGLKGNETKDQFGNPLPPTAYEYINQRLEAARAKGTVSTARVQAIQYEAQARYNLPKNFDISGKGFGNWDSSMAKQINKMPYNGNQQNQAPVEQETKATEPVETEMTEQQPNNATDSKQASVAPEQKKPELSINGPEASNDELNAAFKRIKNKQASDADLALFNKYSEEQLQRMGFGPISIQAIKGTEQNDSSTRTGPAGGNGLGQNPVEPGEMEAANQKVADAEANVLKLSDEDQAFVDKYRSYTRQLSGAQPRSDSALKAMQGSDAYKFVNDSANKERYSQLLKTEAENKKTNKANISAAKAERNNVGMAKAMDQYYAHH